MLHDILIAPFQDFEFMRRALVGVCALALGAGPIGVFLMLRRMSLVGDAMAHAILPGAAIGFLISGLNLYAMTAGGLIAGFVVALARVAVEDTNRVDVSALALGPGRNGRGHGCRVGACGELIGRRRRPDRVVVGHGDPPLRHRAPWILPGHVLERAARFLVAERVQERGGAREGGRGFLRAGHREVHGAELLPRGVRVGMILSARVTRRRGQGCGQDDGEYGGHTSGHRVHFDLRTA